MEIKKIKFRKTTDFDQVLRPFFFLDLNKIFVF